MLNGKPFAVSVTAIVTRCRNNSVKRRSYWRAVFQSNINAIMEHISIIIKTRYRRWSISLGKPTYKRPSQSAGPWWRGATHLPSQLIFKLQYFSLDARLLYLDLRNNFLVFGFLIFGFFEQGVFFLFLAFNRFGFRLKLIS